MRIKVKQEWRGRAYGDARHPLHFLPGKEYEVDDELGHWLMRMSPAIFIEAKSRSKRAKPKNRMIDVAPVDKAVK